MNDTNTNQLVTTNEFQQSIQATGSTVEAVLAAREKAIVEARLIVAMKRPRDWNDVRIKLLAAIERPGFADSDLWETPRPGSAMFRLTFGQTRVEGLSIRFAEEALRAMGNLDCRSSIIWEDDQQRIIAVEVFDLESNVSIPTQIVVKKTREKKKLWDGEESISMRMNSSGEPVYLVYATDPDVLKKQNAEISKAIRNGILRLLPGDIQAECREKLLAKRYGKEVVKDPEKATRDMLDAFVELGVKPSDIKELLGHSVGSASPAQIGELRKLYKKIKDGKTTWANVVSDNQDEPDEKPPENLNELTDNLKKRQDLKPAEKLATPDTDADTDTDTDNLTAHQTRVIAAAKGFYGDENYEDNLQRLCKKGQKKIDFKKATPMDCNYLKQLIEEEANRERQ